MLTHEIKNAALPGKYLPTIESTIDERIKLDK
jgi:hypothetical protein